MTTPIVNQLDVERTTAPMILILGQTGAGKSYFCNKVLGEDVKAAKESAHLESCTSEPQLVPAKVDDADYLLVDTPGFNDTWRDFKRSDARILGEIAQALILQTQLGLDLRGILYLYDISAKRMTGDTLRQFELIKRICGKSNYSNVLLVTTNWPRSSQEQIRQHCGVREGDLRRGFWKEMIQGGSSMCRFNGGHSDAKAIVRRFVGKPNVTLALQDEMAQGYLLKSTSAFQFIVEARKQDERKLESGSDVEESEVSQEGVTIRKEDETQLSDDMVARVQSRIVKEEAAVRKRNRKATVLDLIKWIISLTSIAMGEEVHAVFRFIRQEHNEAAVF